MCDDLENDSLLQKIGIVIVAIGILAVVWNIVPQKPMTEEERREHPIWHFIETLFGVILLVLLFLIVVNIMRGS